MDKDFINSISIIFDESTQDGIEYMERTLCMNNFPHYSQFKQYFQNEYKSTQCHHFWLFPKFCVLIPEPNKLCSHDYQTICLNCFVNSQINLQPKSELNSDLYNSIRIQSISLGRCKCGARTCSNPFTCSSHVPIEKPLNSDYLFYKETIQNVVSATFSKFDTVLKKKTFYLRNNGNESIITFIKGLAEINDVFIAEVGNAILTNKDQIQKLILESKYYTYNINLALCQLFSLLSFQPTFLNEFLFILLKISHLFIIDCFKNVSRKLRDDTPPNQTLIWMNLYNFPIDFSIQLLDKEDFDSFEFAKNFISHFQSQIIKTKFLDVSSYPTLYKSVLKIFQTQIEFISRQENENEEDDEQSQSIQILFDSVFEALNELESNFDTKFMQFTEEDEFRKLIYLYEFTYNVVKLFFSKDESQYKVNIDISGLTDVVFCALDYNFISENLFDNSNEAETEANENETQAETQSNEDENGAKEETQNNEDESKNDDKTEMKSEENDKNDDIGDENDKNDDNDNKNDDNDDDNDKADDDDDECEDSILTKSIRSENVNVSLFNQLIHFFSFYIVNMKTPIINLRDILEPNILLYGSIIPTRLLTWHFSYKMNLGSTLNGGGDNFFKEFSNDVTRRKYLFYGNFGYIQIASLLLESDELEQLSHMIASSFGIYEKSTINNNLNEYLPTLKLCFIFFIGCLYFDRYTSLRSKVGEYNGKAIFRMIQMIHLLKKGNVYLKNLTRKGFDIIDKVAFKRKTTNDQTIYCLKKKEELPINWNPFYVFNPINEVISLVANEIPSKGLLILPSVEDELNGTDRKIEDDKFEGLEFHHILMTPTVFSIIYSILSDFFIEKQKNVESIHLSLNLLLVIINKLEANENYNNDNDEVFTASNLRQLTNLCSCSFEEFVSKKINFIGRGENSLLDLLLKLNEISEPVIKELQKKFPLLIKKNKNDDDDETKNKTKNSQRAKELKRTISERFQSQIDLFKSSSLNAEFLEEEEEEDTNGVCQICHTFKEKEGLCYMVYIYETSLPSFFEPFKDKLPRDVFQFSICNHLFHRNCAFQETGVPPTDHDFQCPIDRYNKNTIMPKIDGYEELDETTIFELNIFFVNLNASFEKVVISFASIFVMNEVRFRLNEIQDQVKYSSQILLARNLYFILWHAIRKLEMTIDKTGMTLFQRFISSLLLSEFRGNVLKYRRLVCHYSTRVDGIEKALFLRRCRIFEHFIYTCKNNDTEIRLQKEELLNKNLWDHFAIESDVDKAETEYNFLCNHFKRFLPSKYIELCLAYDLVVYDNRVSALNLVNGSIVKNRWGSTLAFLLNDIMGDNDEDEEEMEARIPMFLRQQKQKQQQRQQPVVVVDDGFRSDDSEVFMLVVESEFEDQELNAINSNDTNSNENANDNNNNNDNEGSNSDAASADAASGDDKKIKKDAEERKGIPTSNGRNSPMLLMMIGRENSMVIIAHGKSFIELKSFYVDVDGEPDVGFKRGRMLYFNEENYELAVDSLLSGDFTMKLSSIYF